MTLVNSTAISDNEVAVEYSMEVPELVGHRDRGIERNINSDVRSAAEDEVDRLAAMVTEYDIGPATLTITSAVTLLDPQVYSVEMRTSFVTPTTVHPNQGVLTMSFWLRDGWILRLDDLLQSYDYPFGRKIREQLPHAFGDIDDEAFAGYLKDGNFAVTRQGLSVVFPPCSFGPCAAGYMSAELRYSDLRELIDPAGPIGHLL